MSICFSAFRFFIVGPVETPPIRNSDNNMADPECLLSSCGFGDAGRVTPASSREGSASAFCLLNSARWWAISSGDKQSLRPSRRAPAVYLTKLLFGVAPSQISPGALGRSSDLDGAFGTGASFSTSALTTAGVHRITASVTDSDGLPGRTSITVVIEPRAFVIGPAGSDGYALSGGRNQDRHLTVTVRLVDGSEAPVEGASVSATISDPVSSSGTRLMDTLGEFTFKISGASASTYTTTVTSVTAAGLVWDGTTPPNSLTK